MAKSAKAVGKFLEDLAAKLKPLVNKELKELSRYKSEEVCCSSLDCCVIFHLHTSVSNVV